MGREKSPIVLVPPQQQLDPDPSQLDPDLSQLDQELNPVLDLAQDHNLDQKGVRGCSVPANVTAHQEPGNVTATVTAP